MVKNIKASMQAIIVGLVTMIIGYVIIDSLTGAGGIVSLPEAVTNIIGILWIVLVAAIMLASLGDIK